MAKVPFDSIFTINQDGSIEPKQTIRVGGVTMSPGVKFTRGVSFAGIDIAQFVDRDLEINTDEGVVVITGIY